MRDHCESQNLSAAIALASSSTSTYSLLGPNSVTQKAIENIVSAHILAPLPEKVVFQGGGYVVEGGASA